MRDLTDKRKKLDRLRSELLEVYAAPEHDELRAQRIVRDMRNLIRRGEHAVSVEKAEKIHAGSGAQPGIRQTRRHLAERRKRILDSRQARRQSEAAAPEE